MGSGDGCTASARSPSRTAPAVADEHADRVALIRIRFPRLAEIADREAARGVEWGLNFRGPAEGVIHTAATEPQLWIGETRPDLVGWYGSWESYVELACSRIKALKGANR